MRHLILISLLAGTVAACDPGSGVRLPEINLPNDTSETPAPDETAEQPVTQAPDQAPETTPDTTEVAQPAPDSDAVPEPVIVDSPVETPTEEPAIVAAPAPPQPIVTAPAAIEIISTAELIDHDGDTRVPSTNKLVRGIRNAAELTMKPGETITLALNANRDLGFVWNVEGPIGPGTGLRFIADYYRDGESPFFDRGTTGGARYFQFEAEGLGSFPLTINHMDGETIRATKTVTLVVTE